MKTIEEINKYIDKLEKHMLNLKELQIEYKLVDNDNDKEEIVEVMNEVIDSIKEKPIKFMDIEELKDVWINKEKL